jgi:OmpA-OmpF porin, OOP family
MDKTLQRALGWALVILPFILCPAITCHQTPALAFLGKDVPQQTGASARVGATPGAPGAPTPVATVATATEGNLEASVGDDGKITLSGIVPDEATKTQILDKAKEAYGADNVIDSTIEVKEGAKSDWVAAALAVLPEIKSPSVKGGGLTATNAKLSVRGTLESDATKSALGEKLKTSVGSLELADETTATSTSAPEATPEAPAATPEVPTATPEAPEATPEPEVKKIQGELNKGLELKIVEFATNKATLTRRGQQTLDFVVSELKKVPDAPVEISGHTDNRGDDAMNQKLSETRAQATLAYLVKHGITKERLTASGLGETTPKASNNTASGRQRNRRIEFKLK